jgi:hypothetical protein
LPTIAISAAAGASAAIDYLTALAPVRVPLALALLVVVAGLTWFGHIGRAVFATMTVLFIVAGIAVLVGGLDAPVADTGVIAHDSGRPAGIAIVLAFPVAMALPGGSRRRPRRSRSCASSTPAAGASGASRCGSRS